MAGIYVPFEIKAVDAEAGTFSGLASTFGGEPDTFGDVVAPGAFKDSLAEHKRKGSQPALLRDHDPSKPVGVWTAIRETKAGLEVEGKLTLGVELARETLALLKDKALGGLSIGYRTKSARQDAKAGARILERVELFEISLVAMPANPAARIVAVKAGLPEDERDLERRLRDVGLSRQWAKRFAAQYRPPAEGQREAEMKAVSDLVAAVRAATETLTARTKQNGHA